MPRYCGILQIEPVDGIITVAASITTNANPILPGVGEANSNAWVGATNGATGTALKWAQTGYLWRRLEDGSRVCNVYVEVQAGPNDPTDYFVQYFAAPPGGSHRYTAVLDEFTGTWYFFFDLGLLAQFQHDGWKDITARKTQFTCEINGDGAQVLGTDGTPCTFGDCEYEIASPDWQNPHIVHPDFNDDEVWRVLDELQGGGVGSVTIDPMTNGEFSTSREVDLSLALTAGGVDRGGRPQAGDSWVPAPSAPASRPAGEEALQAAQTRLAASLSGGALADAGIASSRVDPETGSLLVSVQPERFRNLGQLQRRLRAELGEVPVRLVPAQDAPPEQAGA